ncbi:lipopolysaccharide biosynthesis protein [Hazenella coriacea]|uniref:O-antigen/teichoic acid export membrane protein n=1 Tax=Hazenella coriacea TaxID=1179467 RepID=A0A4V2UVF7_9BACL|nr:polysaccharide biosynthesis C-terminal domain-containing protein [Hazenella coriacea]TCS95627.1 O-antigen/teichoic acid export membrane protein [Hazenella coriacea]
MKSYMKRLFTDSAAFAVSTFGNKLAALLLVPVYTRYLTGIGELADWGLTNTVTLILSYICILGTDAAMAFYFYDAKNEVERRTYFSHAIIFSIGMCLLFTLIVWFTGEPLAEFVYQDGKDYNLLLPIAFMATLGAIIIQHILAYARYQRKVWLFNFFSMAYVIGSSLLSIYFLVYQKQGVVGIFIGQLIGQLSIALMLIWLFRKEFIFRPSFSHLRQLIQYGLPLLPTLISFWVMTSVSRPILYHLDSPHYADIYEACIRIASFIVLLTSPFQLAWRPFSMSIKEKADAPQIYGFVGRIFFVVGTWFILVLTFFIDPLYQWIIGRPDIQEGYLYVWALSLGTLLNVLHHVFGVGLLIEKKTKLISYGFTIAAVIFLLGNLLLVPLFHIWGSVIMTIASYLFVIIWVYIQNQKVYPIDFRFGSILTYLLVYVTVMGIISWAQATQFEFLWLVYLLGLVITIMTALGTRLIHFQTVYQMGERWFKLKK